MFNVAFRWLVLIALLLNGTGAHGLTLLIESSDAASPPCHSAAAAHESAYASHATGSVSTGGDSREHHCGGADCSCPCANHTPPLGLPAIIPGSLPAAAYVLTAGYTSFHSLTPPPLLRPPIP